MNPVFRAGSDPHPSCVLYFFILLPLYFRHILIRLDADAFTMFLARMSREGYQERRAKR
jgi:hypothetical protein